MINTHENCSVKPILSDVLHSTLGSILFYDTFYIKNILVAQNFQNSAADSPIYSSFGHTLQRT